MISVNWSEATLNGLVALFWALAGALILLAIALTFVSRSIEGHWAWQRCDLCRRRSRVRSARRAMHRRSSRR